MKMKFDDWDKKYKSIVHPDDPHCYLYETYGEDLDRLKQYKQGNIWTVVDGPGSKLFIIPGVHWVNRLGYMVTEHPWTDEDKNLEVAY